MGLPGLGKSTLLRKVGATVEIDGNTHGLSGEQDLPSREANDC